MLRTRLANRLHMGELHPGDRLPSIRAVARETGADHRAVARAYRALEREGLVEVRGRSGVCVAPGVEGAVRGEGALRERERWVAEVLAQSWQRNIGPGELQGLLEACTARRPLTCACVESNLDQMTAYCTEVASLTGMRMRQVYVEPGAEHMVSDPGVVRRALEGADLVITTHYHAPAVRALLGDSPLPVVVIRINPVLADSVRARLRGPGMTVVACTAAFAERLRLMYADALADPDRLRFIAADDAEALARLDPREPILLTRAARARLPALHAPTLVFPHSPTVDADTVRELSEVVVRLNLSKT